MRSQCGSHRRKATAAGLAALALATTIGGRRFWYLALSITGGTPRGESGEADERGTQQCQRTRLRHTLVRAVLTVHSAPLIGSAPCSRCACPPDWGRRARS